jgi:cell division inhibitor SepF
MGKLSQGFKNLFVGEEELEQEEIYASAAYSGIPAGRPETIERTAAAPVVEQPQVQPRMEPTKTLQIVLARPNDFSEVKSIGDDINDQKTVLLNLETVKSEDAKRILDFISGVAYANGADIKMMAQKTFAIMPRNVGFSGVDLMSELENNGYSF